MVLTNSPIGYLPALMSKLANQAVGQLSNQSYLRQEADDPKLGGQGAQTTDVGHSLHRLLDDGFRRTTFLSHLPEVLGQGCRRIGRVTFINGPRNR